MKLLSIDVGITASYKKMNPWAAGVCVCVCVCVGHGFERW